MIVVCGGIKGGSGKTTVAINLAVIRALDGYDVLLVDADDQETATDFTRQRNERTGDQAGYTSTQLHEDAVRTEVRRFRDKYDDIVIDTGGRDTTSQRAALTIADILLVPFIPRSFDVWTLEKVEKLVGLIQTVNSELRAYLFLNRADAIGQDNAEASELLKETAVLSFLDSPLGYRKAFGKAAAQGLAVTELKPPDSKATNEMMALYSNVFGAKKI